MGKAAHVLGSIRGRASARAMPLEPSPTVDVGAEPDSPDGREQIRSGAVLRIVRTTSFTVVGRLIERGSGAFRDP